MEKRVFTTKIKNCKNNFIVGKIVGIMEAVCDYASLKAGVGFGIYSKEIGRDFETYLRVNTTYERYCIFVEICEAIYPDICEYDDEYEDQ